MVEIKLQLENFGMVDYAMKLDKYTSCGGNCPILKWAVAFDKLRQRLQALDVQVFQGLVRPLPWPSASSGTKLVEGNGGCCIDIKIGQI